MEQKPADPAGEQVPISDEETTLAEGERSEDPGPGSPEAPGGLPATKTPRPKRARRIPSRATAKRHAPLRPRRRKLRKNVLRIEQEGGILEMSDAVIATIVREEGLDENVLEIRGRGVVRKLWKMLTGRRLVDGVQIKQRDHVLSVDVMISVRYGINIPALAKELRKKVADKIEYITGCKAEAVNIIVDRIVMRAK